MKKIIRFFRNDFAKVRLAMLITTNDRCPMWVSIVWYVVVAPFGLIAAPFALLWYWLYMKYLIWKLENL